MGSLFYYLYKMLDLPLWLPVDAKFPVEDYQQLMARLEERSRENPWLAETVSYLRKLLDRRDHEAMEKELMYSSDKLKNRIADLDDSVMFCMSTEAVKPAFLRKKVTQGRNSDSQA